MKQEAPVVVRFSKKPQPACLRVVFASPENPEPYLEGHGHLASIPVSPTSLVIAPAIPLINLLTKTR